MTPRTMAVPMSGWARISTQAKPVTMSSGPMMRRSAASSSRRRVMKSAANDGEGELHQLGGLQAELPEADPAARAHGVHAEARDQHHEEEAERHQHDERAEAPQLAVVEADGEPEHDGADRHPHDLADQDGPRRPVGGDGDDRGRRAHHDEPDEAEQDDVDEQQRRDRDRGGCRCGCRALGAAAWRCATSVARCGRLRLGRGADGAGVVCRSDGAMLRVNVTTPLPLGAGAPLCPVRHPMHASSLPHGATEVADRARASDAPSTSVT